jgi:phosphatidylserine/phosphatidylglycerophosphate/cardiolipin synthase-like enzyme
LHAKIYLIDDSAIVTSANLTNTAFAKRFEIGLFLSGKEISGVEKTYSKWFKEYSDDVLSTWKPEKKKGKVEGGEEATSSILPTL